jgi:tetratricopeptide (TPR) repeat protein
VPAAFEPAPPERVFFGRAAALLPRGREALLSSQGRGPGTAEAEVLLSTALRWAPLRAENWEAWAVLCSFQGKPEEAAAALKEALRRHPRNAVWWMELAWLDCERGLPGEAAEALHAALRAEPRFLQAAYGLGLLMESRGEKEKARRWMDRLKTTKIPLAGTDASPYARAVLSRRFPPVLPERKR